MIVRPQTPPEHQPTTESALLCRDYKEVLDQGPVCPLLSPLPQGLGSFLQVGHPGPASDATSPGPSSTLSPNTAPWRTRPPAASASFNFK